MGKMQRAKGARVEREIAALLTEELGVVVKRKLGAARDGGDDIVIGKKYSVEVKARKAFSVSAFLRQAESNCGTMTPVVVLREDGDREPMALLRLRDLLPLIRGEL